MTDVKVMPELARALRDGGHYSQVMPELNVYYGLLPGFSNNV